MGALDMYTKIKHANFELEDCAHAWEQENKTYEYFQKLVCTEICTYENILLFLCVCACVRKTRESTYRNLSG